MSILARALTLLAALSGASLLGAACVHTPRPSDHLFPEAFTPMGHRGARGLAPENTMAAFQIAADLGIPFELDTSKVATGELVVFHDDTLERLTSEAGKGPLGAISLETLRGLEAGAHFDASFKGEPIPELAQVLDTFGGKVLINIEIKAPKGADATDLATSVVALVESRDLVEGVVISSFSPFVLEAVRAANPAIYRGQIYSRFENADLKLHEKILLRNLAFNRWTRPDLLMVHSAMVDRRYVRKMHRRGYRIFPWTVNEPEEMTYLMDLGVDGIITDFPDVLLAVMAARAGG